MVVSKWSVSLSPDAAEFIQERSSHGDRSTQITRSLDRYAAILSHERQELAALLSDGEIGLICDTFNGIAFWDTISLRLAWANVQDAIEMDGLDKKWQIEGDQLVAKIRKLTMAQNVALVDAVELWWNRISEGEKIQPTVAEVFGEKTIAKRYPNNES